MERDPSATLPPQPGTPVGPPPVEPGVPDGAMEPSEAQAAVEAVVPPAPADQVDLNEEFERAPDHVKTALLIQNSLKVARAQSKHSGTGTEKSKFIQERANLSANLVTILMDPKTQEDPGGMPLKREAYELLAYFFNKTSVPERDQIIGLRNVVNAQDDPTGLLDDPSLQDEERKDLWSAIGDVQEKSRPEYWMLTDEQRAWYARVAEAPSLSPYAAPVEPPPRTFGDKKDKFIRQRFAPKGTTRRKVYDTYLSLPKVDPRYTPPPSPDKSKYLTKEEIARVKEEFWYENPREQLTRPPGAAKNENKNLILGTAKDECNRRLAIDNRMQALADQVKGELAMSREAQHTAKRADELGALGVRNEADQRSFEEAEKSVKRYNESLEKRKTRESVVASGVGLVSLRSVELAKVTREVYEARQKEAESGATADTE